MKKEFIVQRSGKDFVLYAGLLDQAFEEGLVSIQTRLIQAPNDANGHLAISYAEVVTNKGKFTGIGDASPENVGRMIALRDAINVAVTALEELAIDDPQEEERVPQRHANHSRVPSRLPSEAIAGIPSRPRRETPAQTPAQDDNQPTAQQIDRLHKLQAALGRAPMVNTSLTSEQAAEKIAELVQIFNQQSKQAPANQTPPDHGALPAAPAQVATIRRLLGQLGADEDTIERTLAGLTADAAKGTIADLAAQLNSRTAAK